MVFRYTSKPVEKECPNETSTQWNQNRQTGQMDASGVCKLVDLD